jgi:glycogen debranching enzyme
MARMSARSTVGREECRDFARSSKLEWLETNGTGAFAMGTVAGVNTRRYHGLLVASLKPPVERYVLLSRVEEQLVFADKTFELGVCQYPGVVSPRGFEHLEEFTTEPSPTWRYYAGGITLEKQVSLVPGAQTVEISYRADRPVTLRVRPFIAYRDYHSLTHENPSLNFESAWAVSLIGGGRYSRVIVGPYYGLPKLFLSLGDAGYTPDPHWYKNIEYLEELDRGLDFREDLFTPGVATLELQRLKWTTIRASIGQFLHSDPLPASGRPFVVSRVDGTPTIIAGYPWFTDWGRDTMISIPGLLLAKGQLDTARQIIESFLTHLNNGLIPNRFPDDGHLPEYNDADATLWMFQAVREYLAAGGDRAFLRDVFYRAGQEIIDWHLRGTLYSIHVDPRDHLLSAGTEGTQLTWMDVKIGDWVVTPRHGKPVELNALWHSALRLMSEWARSLNDDSAAERYEQDANALRASFRSKFWNTRRACLYDVLTDAGPIAKLRPNQIFAVSVPHPLLEPEQQRAVVTIVERELLTPVGLRTLERGDPDYRSRFGGPAHDRDAAYHQGTVWPWLIGPFVDAYLNAFGQTARTLGYCKSLVDALENEAAKAGCLGSIAEIYDAEEPRRPRGCPAQAWSVAEVARVRFKYGW